MLKKKNIILYFVLSFFTLGIYSFFFWYKWTENVNKVCGDDDKESANYILVLILSIMTLGIYTLVWNYQMGERLYQKAPDYGVKIKHGGMFIMVCRFLPIVCSALKIAYLNKLIEEYNSNPAAANKKQAEVEE